MAEEIRHIKTPTDLIWGKNDNITPPFVGEEFRKLIPNSHLAWIDECGHAAMMEQPEQFNKLLEGFLRSIDETVSIDSH
jgi:pimeloyl-ACP methyl ester carboxylesterase